MNDLRFALRQLLKNPGFTAVAVITLALGIGANTAIFSVVNGVLLAPLPFREPENLVRVHESVLARGQDRIPVSAPIFLDWRNQSSSFQALSATASTSYNLTGQGEARRLIAARVSANFFDTLGVQPVLGRTFLADEEALGRHRVAILSRATWQRTFAGDPGIVGRSINLDGEVHLVVGIVQDGIGLPSPKTELWTPLAFTKDELDHRGTHMLRVIGRLNSGVSLIQARAEMEGISTRLANQFADSKDFSSRLIRLHEEPVGKTRRPLLVLLGAVACVLLIACANVANLRLARAAARSREFAVRASLGAGRRQILRQLLTEGLVLGVIAGALGVWLGHLGLAAIVAFAPADLPRMSEVSVNFPVLVFSLFLVLGTGVVSGLAPALGARRLNLSEVLKESGRGLTGGLRRNRIRSMLVVGEIALSLVLLAGAGLLLRSFARLQEVDPGFQPAHLLTANLALPERRYPAEQLQAATFQRIVADAAGLLYEIPPHDPPTFGFVSLLLAIVALLAVWIPARRATRVDPMVALRCE